MPFLFWPMRRWNRWGRTTQWKNGAPGEGPSSRCGPPARRREAALVGEEDAPFAGGSYVLVQKYLHDMKAWNALPVEAQERIIGRKKLSDIELDDATKPSSAHNALTVIDPVDDDKLARGSIDVAKLAMT
jgi:deferrochelatase/peroxidase EfeB